MSAAFVGESTPISIMAPMASRVITCEHHAVDPAEGGRARAARHERGQGIGHRTGRTFPCARISCASIPTRRGPSLLAKAVHEALQPARAAE